MLSISARRHTFAVPMTLLFWALGVLSQADAQVYELRTYVAQPGKLDALNARFRDHTVGLFSKHGIESIGYWVPTDPQRSSNTLIYLIKHDSREAAARSWKSFGGDPDWKAAAKASGVGKLAAPIESVYLETTEYSPAVPTAKAGATELDTSELATSEGNPAEEDSNSPGLFELRIYEARPGTLGKLDARFQDHTIGLFAKHGIRSIGYWHDTKSPDAQSMLYYIIRHDSESAAKKSWDGFRVDPQWHAARDASGVGKLAHPPTSVYMKPTDYSPLK